jgi:hypothetical protein
MVNRRLEVICAPNPGFAIVGALQVVNGAMAFMDLIRSEPSLLKLAIHVAREYTGTEWHVVAPLFENSEAVVGHCLPV